jgi:hypothetical protein
MYDKLCVCKGHKFPLHFGCKVAKCTKEDQPVIGLPAAPVPLAVLSCIAWYSTSKMEAKGSFNMLVSIYQATYEVHLKSNEAVAIKYFY